MTSKTTTAEQIAALVEGPFAAVLVRPDVWLRFAASPAGDDLLHELREYLPDVEQALEHIERARPEIDKRGDTNVLNNPAAMARMTSDEINTYRDARVAYNAASETLTDIGNHLDRWRGVNSPGWLATRLQGEDVRRWAGAQIKALLGEAGEAHATAQAALRDAAALAGPTDLDALVPQRGKTIRYSSSPYEFIDGLLAEFDDRLEAHIVVEQVEAQATGNRFVTSG